MKAKFLLFAFFLITFEGRTKDITEGRARVSRAVLSDCFFLFFDLQSFNGERYAARVAVEVCDFRVDCVANSETLRALL